MFVQSRLQTLSETFAPKLSIRDRWSIQDEELLLHLLDSGAIQLQLLYSFPTRKWWRIRFRITVLRGKGITIPRIRVILREERFADYLTRIGMTEEELIVAVLGLTSLSPDRGGNHAHAR
jgi:hypothetical protein